MKLTIIPIDGAVYKDGYSYVGLNLSFIPPNVHALQFNDASNKGWIEFIENNDSKKSPNEEISSLPEWATIAVTKWEEAKATQEAAAMAAKEAALLTEAAKDQPLTSGVTTL